MDPLDELFPALGHYRSRGVRALVVSVVRPSDVARYRMESDLCDAHARVHANGVTDEDFQSVLTREPRVPIARRAMRLDKEAPHARFPVKHRFVLVGSNDLLCVHQVSDARLQDPSKGRVDAIFMEDGPFLDVEYAR